MDTLQINVKGWPEQYVQLVRKYAEQVGSAVVSENGIPSVPEEELRRLADEGVICRAKQRLADYLKLPPSGPSPSGVLEELLREREHGR
ncbi:MAG: hypothetical protein HY721_03840 [Planctomycetes bacterium]|nr:hypothetical protein [Planctomycetota bacterium]